GVPVLSWFQLPFMVDHLKHSITGTAGGESPVQRLNAVRSRAKALPIANFHYSLALELSEQNRWEEADRALRAALDAPALMDHTLHLRVRLNLVYVQRMLYPNRTWPGATRLVEEIIKDPAFDASVARYVSNNLSWCAHMPAYRHVTQAWLDLEPTSPQALDAYAYMLYKAGDYGGVVLTIDRIRPEAQLPAPQLDRIRGLRTKAVTHLGMIGPPFEARRLEELTEMNWIQDVGKLPKSVVATRVSAALDVVRNLRMTRQLSRASRLLKLVAKPAQQFEPRRWCREQYACLRDLGRTVEALQVAVEAMRKGGNDADRRELSRALANCGLYGKALRIGRPCVESGSTLSASQRESFRSSLAHLELAAHAQRHASTLPATMVWSIPRDSPAFALGFRPGDVVVAVGKEAVGDPASYFRIRARLGEGAEAMFRLRRGARELDPVKTQGPINMQVFKLRAVDPKGDAVDVTF
ncbi:MAG: hypothetical protein KDC87_05040, partial [Planctomycetes bacterium]|nr:hypothetical protein [Planctomycetota bacterium]